MSDETRDRLGAAPRPDELTQLHETRRPESEGDSVRDAGFDAYSAPELHMASSMSGPSRMQRIVALVILLSFLAVFGVAFFG